MFSVLVIRLRSLRLLRVSGIVMRLRMFLLLITFLKASHSFRNRLLVICKNAYLFATMIMTSVSRDRKSGSAGMPRPISYAVFCLKKKTLGVCKTGAEEAGVTEVRTSLSEKKFELWREIKVRSEERFSRNAETDLVCRLLLEKKKKKKKRK